MFWRQRSRDGRPGRTSAFDTSQTAGECGARRCAVGRLECPGSKTTGAVAARPPRERPVSRSKGCLRPGANAVGRPSPIGHKEPPDCREPQTPERTRRQARRARWKRPRIRHAKGLRSASCDATRCKHRRGKHQSDAARRDGSHLRPNSTARLPPPARSHWPVG